MWRLRLDEGSSVSETLATERLVDGLVAAEELIGSSIESLRSVVGQL